LETLQDWDMAKGLGKQAKVLSERQIDTTIAVLSKGKRAERDTVAFLLSVRAGLRAKEVAAITWCMVTDSAGNVGDEIRLTNDASKGKSGRVIDMNRQLKAALIAYQRLAGGAGDEPVIGGTAGAMRVWFLRLYDGMGIQGASSHSGRRTAIARWARKITEAGGSLRDVQDMAGHADLATTQRYIDVNKNAKRRVVNL
jgi:integrase/recombinase XerC